MHLLCASHTLALGGALSAQIHTSGSVSPEPLALDRMFERLSTSGGFKTLSASDRAIRAMPRAPTRTFALPEIRR